MSPSSRLFDPGSIHHITSRGNRRQTVFLDDDDRRLFIHELGRVVVRRGWHCLAYCLMGNHYHLVVKIPGRDRGDGMRDLLSRFAQRSNQRHGLVGHMFQGRYRPVLVENDPHFAWLLRYVALNPVTAGFCSDPREWRWSSHVSLLAGCQGPLADVHQVEQTLACWGGEYGTRYAAMFAPDSSVEAWGATLSAEPPRPSLAELLRGAPLDQALVAARHQHGYRLREIAEATGLSITTVARRTTR